jgi:inositol hexakisphosphate/diphosphoinositol-pentakisphosphate kinase
MSWQAPLLELFNKYKDAKGKQAKLKSPGQLQELLDVVRSLLAAMEADAAAIAAASKASAAGGGSTESTSAEEEREQELVGKGGGPALASETSLLYVKK